MTRQSLLFLFISLLFASCTKEVDESVRTETMTREVKAYLDKIGTYPVEEFTRSENVLSRKDDPAQMISDPDKIEGKADFYIRTQRTIQKLEKSAIDNIPPTGIAGIIWPGALLQGRTVREGQPALVPIYDKRKPGRISLNVVSGDESCFYRDVTTFSASNLTQAMNDILAPYTSGFPANTSFSIQTVHSKEEMAYMLDMEPNAFDALSQGAFDGVKWTHETTKVMIKLRQVFFTMVYDHPNISDVFTNDITAEELNRYSGEGNPIAYVSSVSYGRYFILLYESEATERVLNAAVSSAYVNPKEQDAPGITPQNRSVLRRARVTMRQIGGDPEAGLATITGDPEKIRDFIVKGATFSRNNVGEVMDYQVHYLCNNQFMPVYKELDTTFDVVEYNLAPKNNQVRITLRNIRCLPLVQTGGNGNISDKSHFSCGPLTVTVYNENGTVEKEFPDFNLGLWDVKTNGVSTTRYYNQVFNLGELGLDTKKKIVMKGSVFFYNRRTWSKNDTNARSTWNSQNYPFQVEFRYNSTTKRWEARYNANSKPELFREIAVEDNLCSCNLRFYLDFGFYANYENYK